MRPSASVSLPCPLCPLLVISAERGRAQHPTVVSHSPPSFSSYCVMLRSLSSTPLLLVTLANTTRRATSLLLPGGLASLWVTEQDTLLGYMAQEGGEPHWVVPSDSGVLFLVLAPPSAQELQRAREQQAFTAAYHALSGHWWLSHYDFRCTAGSTTTSITSLCGAVLG